MIQLENRWTGLNEIWQGCYTIGDHREIALFNFPTIYNTNMANEQTSEVGPTPAPLATGPYSDLWLSILEKYLDTVIPCIV
jgi:hypothetical protein